MAGLFLAKFPREGSLKHNKQRMKARVFLSLTIPRQGFWKEGKSRGGIFVVQVRQGSTLALRQGEVPFLGILALYCRQRLPTPDRMEGEGLESGLSGLTSFLQLLTGLGCLRSETSKEGAKKATWGGHTSFPAQITDPNVSQFSRCQRSPPVSRWLTPALGLLVGLPTFRKLPSKPLTPVLNILLAPILSSEILPMVGTTFTTPTAQRLENVFREKNEVSPWAPYITDSLHILLKLVPQSQQTRIYHYIKQKGFSLSRGSGLGTSIYFLSQKTVEKLQVLTKHERCLPRGASSPPPANGTFQPTFLTSKGRQPSELCKFPHFSGRQQCKIRKDLNILSDPSHDKIFASANFCTSRG